MPDAETSRWGIYRRDREWAREKGDPCLAVVSATDKEGAENQASLEGVCGPTGIWAHPLPEGEVLRDQRFRSTSFTSSSG